MKEKWECVETVVIETAQKFLGKAKRKTGKYWFDEECDKALQERQKARLQMIRDGSEKNRIIYCEMRRKAKRVCRSKKRKATNKKLQDIENHHVNKRIRIPRD